MKIISRLAILSAISLLWLDFALASDEAELEAMLNEFLIAADQEAAHASFWAEDLVYTSSVGLRFGKADIMAGFEGAAEDEVTDDAAMLYSSEELDIRIYGDTAVVAFKLVGTPTDESADDDVLYYFNTGTFLRRDGVWRVVAWQATKIPPS